MVFRRPSKSTGFTLIELAICIALIAVLTTLGYPILTDLAGGQRLKAVSEELAASFHLARAEAVKRNGSVYMSALGETQSSSAWTGGWRIWVDDNSNDQFDPEQDTELLARNALASNINISSKQNLHSIRYNSTGFADRINAKAFNDVASHLLICVGEKASRVIVHRSGRIEQRSLDCPDRGAS